MISIAEQQIEQDGGQVQVAEDLVETGDTNDGVKISDEEISEDEKTEEDGRENKSEDGSDKRVMSEFLLAKMLNLFEGAEITQDIESLMNRSSKLRERREAYGEKILAGKSDSELFCQPESVSDVVKQTKAFQSRAEEYRENYLSQHPTTILLSSADIPDVVLESKTYKERVGKLTKKQKSDATVMQSLQETITALKLSSSKESKDQQRLIAAGATSLKFGVPDLGLSRREEKKAFEMKAKLMEEEGEILKNPEKASRQCFPQGVVQLAQSHWENCTQLEPAKH